MLCDFCYHLNLPAVGFWSYLTEPHTVARDDGTPAFNDDGMWLACDTCSDLIEAGDAKTLLEHSLNTAHLKVGERAVQGWVVKLQASFWEHRLPGPRIRGVPVWDAETQRCKPNPELASATVAFQR